MKTIIKTVCCILIVNLSALAANYTVKSNGSGDYTTIQACATAMSPGDTCTVFAGTYTENVTVPAGSVGNYKILTVNGSDIVSVVGSVTLSSHNELIGNCPTFQGTLTTATCGFFISNPSSPGASACISMGTNTDIYIVHNSISQCGSYLAGPGTCGLGAITMSDGASYIYIQGNSISYPSGPVGGPVGIGILLGLGQNNSSSPNHILVENNDISHYALGVKYGTQKAMIRNNSFHDQYETEGCENQHTDMTFSEQTYNVAHNVIEGNTQRNAVGPNAKGNLAQGDTPCTGCTNLIIRYNVVSGIDGSGSSNYGIWPHLVQYNNTKVDLKRGSSAPDDTDLNDVTLTSTAILNTIYYYTINSAWSNWNSGSCGLSCNAGHNLWYGTGTGFAGTANPYNHIYGGSGGTWTVDPGNLKADPKFVNYVSPANTSNDYHLQASSPAIAAGTYLATVASGDSGSGTSLVVNDASYFQDGYGLSNANSTVSGDCIAVATATNHVCITAVNYSTNTLTLASSISRSSGQGVYLYSKSDGVQVLTGSAPDMGAYPYGSGGGGSPPMPPTGLAAVVN